MKILVTGATGFTGSHLIPHLLEKRLDVTCFIRKDSDLSVLPKDKVRIAIGDLNSPKTLEEALHGIDILINIASLGFGHAEGIVAAAENAGVKRALFISTTAIFTNLNAPSKEMRLAAEKRITESTLDYTVLRPTMIYGSSQDRNICRLIKYLQSYPVLPVIGSGEHLQQPIFVKDVAQAVVQTMYSEKSYRKSYNISGAEPLSFNQVVTTICSQLTRSVRILHVPVTPVVRILSLIEKVVTPPIKAEQILRLNENKNFDHTTATQDFAFSPLSFQKGIHLELKEMGIC